MQSTIRVELTDLARTTVMLAGAEFRCDGEFLRLRTERELIRIRNELANALNVAGANPPIPIVAVPPAEPFICSASPSAVDMGIKPARRTKLEVFGFDLRGAPITAELVSLDGARQNVTGSLAIVSDFHMVLDLTAGGAPPNDTHRRIVFSWDRQAQSTVPILQPGQETTCTTRKVVVVSTKQSFVPQHVSGDPDFVGHGPCVRLTVDLALDAEARRLTAAVSMIAKECDGSFDSPRHDYTEASGATIVELFATTDPAERILTFDAALRSEWQYVDTNHDPDEFYLGGTSALDKVIFTGDTSGDEAGTRTGVQMFFRELRLDVEKCT
jgi:hypothetical protein